MKEINDKLSEISSNLALIVEKTRILKKENEMLKQTIRTAYAYVKDYQKDSDMATHSKRLLANAMYEFDGKYPEKEKKMERSKVEVMADACYLAKSGDDIRDVEMFLEACEQIVRNNINGCDSNISLDSLKKIQFDLILIIDKVKNAISISMSPTITAPKITRPPRPVNICPECGENEVSICKCMRGDSTCKNGHNWHTCTVHMVIVKGKSDHSIPTNTCTCKMEK